MLYSNRYGQKLPLEAFFSTRGILAEKRSERHDRDRLTTESAYFAKVNTRTLKGRTRLPLQ